MRPFILTKHIITIIAFICFLFAIYYPVTKGHYFYGEEHGYIWSTDNAISKDQSFSSYLKQFQFEGRPLEILYLYLTFNKYINSAQSVETANKVRMGSIISLGLFAYVLYIAFRINRFMPINAFLLTIIICTLPPFQVYMGRINCIIFIYAALFSVLSAIVLLNALINKEKKFVHITIAVFISTCLLIIALNIYQPVAMTYWAIGIITLMTLNDENFIRKWGLSYAIFFFCGFLSLKAYQIGTKIIISFMDNTVKDAFYRRGVFIEYQDIYPKILEFINYPLYTALNLWNIFPSKIMGLSVGITILLGILYGIGRGFSQLKRNKESLIVLAGVLCKYFIAISVVILTFLPYIVTKNTFVIMIPKHRVLTGLEIAVFLLFVWGLKQLYESLNISDKLTKIFAAAGLIICTLITAYMAHNNVKQYFVKAHSEELQYIKNMIRDYGVYRLEKDRKMFFVNDDVESLALRSEFTDLSSVGLRGPIMVSKLALFELGVRSDIIFEHIRNDEVIAERENKLIINLSEFRKRKFKELNIPTKINPFFK